MPFFTYVAQATNGSPEGPIDPTDPMAREAQTFPHLGPEMIDRVARYGSEEHFAAGAPVFSRGDRSVDFFVVLEGSIEIFDVDEHDQPQVFAILRERQFAGELDLFNERQVLVSARAGEASVLLRVRRADFRRMVSTESDIGEIVMRAFILRRVGLIRHVHGGVVVVGPAHSADTMRLVQFLSRNAYPHRLLDTEEDADAGGFLDCFSLTADDLPVVIAPGQQALNNPSLAQLADALGLTESFDHDEGVRRRRRRRRPGRARRGGVRRLRRLADDRPREPRLPAARPGRARRSRTTSAFRPASRARRSPAGPRCRRRSSAPGWRCRAPSSASIATPRRTRSRSTTAQSIRARAIVVATGARYRKLDVAGYERFEGAGIYYAATAMEAELCAGDEVVVVGGGNSAGQAAVFLSRSASHVHMLVRGAGLAATMSDYLVQRIERSDRITLYPHTEVTALAGDTSLRRRHLDRPAQRRGDDARRRPASSS